MATDDELLIYNLLVNNWSISAVPVVYYDDSIKLHDFRTKDAIKVYVLHMNETPKGLGYLAYEKEVFITIDIRATSRDRMLNDRDEIKRIILANRKILTGYDIFKLNSERKIAAYLNYFQYVMEVSLLKYRTTI